MLDKDELIAIGKVTRPHGLKGMVRVYPLTDDPARFSGLEQVWLRSPRGQLQKLQIDACQMARPLVLLKLRGIQDRTAADRLRDAEVLIPREACLPLDDGAYYIFDLLGARVETTSGRRIGVLEDVLQYPANDVYVVHDNGQEILIPAVRQFVKRVDVEAGLIVIEPLDGLLPDT